MLPTVCMCCMRAQIEALGKAERNDLISRVAKRMELSRVKVWGGALFVLLPAASL